MSPNAWRVAVAELFLFQDCMESEATYTLAVTRGHWWYQLVVPEMLIRQQLHLFNTHMGLTDDAT